MDIILVISLQSLSATSQLKVLTIEIFIGARVQRTFLPSLGREIALFGFAPTADARRLMRIVDRT